MRLKILRKNTNRMLNSGSFFRSFLLFSILIVLRIFCAHSLKALVFYVFQRGGYHHWEDLRKQQAESLKSKKFTEQILDG